MIPGTRYEGLELNSHAAFVADEIRDLCLNQLVCRFIKSLNGFFSCRAYTQHRIAGTLSLIMAWCEDPCYDVGTT